MQAQAHPTTADTDLPIDPAKEGTGEPLHAQTPRQRTRKAPMLAAGITLAVLAVLGWMEWQGWPFLRAPLEQRLSAKLHHPVRFENGFSLHLLTGLKLKTGVLQVGQPPWLAGPDAARPMIRAEQVDLRVPYGTLFKAISGKPTEEWRIDDIDLASLEANLRRDASNRANWNTTENGLPVQAEATKKPAPIPHIEHLAVRSGALTVEDVPLKLDMKVTLSTLEGEANPQGKGLIVKGDGTYQTHPFEVEAHATGALPLLTQPTKAPPVPIIIRAGAGASKVSFDGVTRDLLSLGSLDGKLHMEGPSLAAMGDAVGVTLPTTAPFVLNGQLKKDGDLWSLNMRELNVGDSRLNGQFSFDRRVAPPVLQGELTGPRLALVDLAPALGAPTRGAPNPKPPNGLVLPQREFDVPSLRAMNAQVRLNIQRVTLGQIFAQPLEPLQADLSLRDGVLTITDVVARTAGGNLGGSIRLNGNGPRLLWDTQLNWSGIKLENWLNAPNKNQAKANPKDKPSYVSGELAGKATLHGEGNSTASLLGSLEGNGMTWISGGKISSLVVQGISLHVAEALGLLLTGDTQQPMQCAAAKLTAHEGRITPDVAIVDTPAATILAAGAVSLAKEQLDLTLTSRPKSLSPLSLRTPVDVRGTFADPSVSLHPNPLTFKVLAAAALATVAAPLAAVVPLIDTGKDHDSGCTQVLQSLKVPVQTPAKASAKATDTQRASR